MVVGPAIYILHKHTHTHTYIGIYTYSGTQPPDLVIFYIDIIASDNRVAYRHSDHKVTLGGLNTSRTFPCIKIYLPIYVYFAIMSYMFIKLEK